MRTRQRGQALPLGLAMILFGILGGFVLYNTGQSATDKARLVNAADAAAYSGILWQARALNFQAYTNRAMVANQVSMAQAVSLRSWAAYGRVTSENISTVLAPIPVIGAVANGVSTVMNGVDQVLDPITNVMLGVVDKINVGVGAAQQGMFLSSFAATPEIVSAVAKASNERFDANTAYSLLGAVGNLQDWQGFTRRVTADDEAGMDARAKTIMNSRDEFSRNRSYSLFGSPLYIIPFQWRVDIKREGETRLIRSADGQGWEWKAKDTVSIHNEFNSWIKGWKGQELPLGWAEAYANNVGGGRGAGDRAGAFGPGGPGGPGGSIEEGSCSDRRQFVSSFLGDTDCRQWFGDNRRAETLADVGQTGLRGAQSRHDMSGYSGINPFRDLSEDTIREDFPTLRLKVEVALPLELTESTDNTVSAEPFATGMSAPGNRFSSISISEVFFKPPEADHEGADNSDIEFANAYSPYWDVRLAPISQADRLAAFALRDHVGSTAPGSVSVPDGGGLAAYGEGAGGASAAGGLGRYAGLAGELGADLDAATGFAAAAAGGDPGSLVGAVRTSFADVDVVALGDQIENELVGALKGAAQDMLRGAVGDATGIESREDLVAWADERTGGLLAEAEEVRAGYEAEVGELRGQQAEFERIAEAVSEDMVELVRDKLAEYGLEQDELLAVADPAEGALDAAGEALPVPSAAEVREARERLAGLEDELVDELTDEMVERVNAVATSYRIPRDVAEATVRMLLRDLRRSPGDEPDWDPFGIEGGLGAARPDRVTESV